MGKRAKIGRPTVLTPEVAKRITDALRLGNFRNAAAGYGGVSVTTLGEWLRAGKTKRRGPLRDFYVAVKKAEAEAHVNQVARLIKHGEKDPRSVQFFLERKFPKQWGRRQQVAVSGEEGAAPIQLEVKDARLSRLSDEQLDQLDAILDAAADSDEE